MGSLVGAHCRSHHFCFSWVGLYCAENTTACCYFRASLFLVFLSLSLSLFLAPSLLIFLFLFARIWYQQITEMVKSDKLRLYDVWILQKYRKCRFSPLEGETVLLVPLSFSTAVAGQVHVSTLVIHFDELSTLKLYIARGWVSWGWQTHHRCWNDSKLPQRKKNKHKTNMRMFDHA